MCIYCLAMASQRGNSEEAPSEPLPLRTSLTPKVLTVTASCGTLTLFYIAVSSILPLFYATLIEPGGLSLDPPRIGGILATRSGFANGMFQLFAYIIFPPAKNLILRNSMYLSLSTFKILAILDCSFGPCAPNTRPSPQRSIPHLIVPGSLLPVLPSTSHGHVATVLAAPHISAT
ncbi:hypothetical protein DFH29DRAFT_106801 [Suillus ampliporus]|nr:hypothetical protein DFH29DRAFT_106801 [Suillus ampliporus]